MTEAERRPVKILTDGYALCTPSGDLLAHTYRIVKDEAIASQFPVSDQGADTWAAAQAEGWTAEYVYARFFSPVFFVDVVPEPVGSTPSTSGKEG